MPSLCMPDIIRKEGQKYAIVRIYLFFPATSGYYGDMGRDKVLHDSMQLVLTAFDIIDEQGYEHFSARRLAARMGISHMTVYNYMQRDELLAQVILYGFSLLNDRIVPHVEECRKDAESARRIFLHIAHELLDFGAAHPNVYRFMFQSNLGLATEDERIGKMYGRGMEYVRDAIPPDRFEAVREDAFLYLTLVNGLVLGYLGTRTSSPLEQFRQRIQRSYELLLGPTCGKVALPG